MTESIREQVVEAMAQAMMKTTPRRPTPSEEGVVPGKQVASIDDNA